MKSLQDHLQKRRGQLGKLLAQTEHLQNINRVFHAYLPGHLRTHAMITKMSAKSWIIQTDSSAWATRLRYVLPNLQQQLRDHLKQEVPPLTVHIRPGNTVHTANEMHRPEITAETARLLKGTAQDLGNSRLGEALLRLSRHVK